MREKVKSLKSFLEWVQEQVFLGIVGNKPLSQEVQEIVNGPSQAAYYYKSCTINGRHYRIESIDKNAPVTTNSGIATPSYIDCVARKNDPRSQRAKLQYYGVLEEIVEVQLSSQRKEVLFRGKWYSTIVGSHNRVTQKEVECGFMKIKTRLNLGNREPWVSADTITQVFYHQDSEDEDWSYVVDVEGRGYMEATTIIGLVLNEPLVESQIRELAGGSNSEPLIHPNRDSPTETDVDEVVVAITVNEAFLEENLANTVRELEVGNSDSSERSDGDSIEREDSDISD